MSERLHLVSETRITLTRMHLIIDLDDTLQWNCMCKSLWINLDKNCHTLSQTNKSEHIYS